MADVLSNLLYFLLILSYLKTRNDISEQMISLQSRRRLKFFALFKALYGFK